MTLINADALSTSPPEWLADGVIPRTGLGIVHGPSYTGKSLVIDGELALAVANGTPFLGHQAVHGTAVIALGEGLYDAGVRKQARLARQASEDAAAVAAITAQRGQEAADAYAAALPAYTDERLFVFTEPFIVPVSQQGEPTTSLTAAITALKQLPDLELVILDSLADFSGGLSISNDASAGRFVLGLKHMVRELDCCVLAVHHNKKDGKGMIGAGRLFNASDFVIEVIPETGTPAGEPKAATLTCKKSKYGPEFAPLTYVIEPLMWDEPERDEDGNAIPGTETPVTAATVRLRDATPGGPALRMPGAVRVPRPLPVVRDVPRPRKRGGLRLVRNGAVAAVAAVAIMAAVPHHHPGPAAQTAAYSACALAPPAVAVPAPVQQFLGQCQAPATAAATPAATPRAAAAATPKMHHHWLIRRLIPRVHVFPRIHLFPRVRLFRTHYLFRF